MSKPNYECLFLIPANHLFRSESLRRWRDSSVFYMAEYFVSDSGFRHHKHKLILRLAAMRAHAEYLRKLGYAVRYEKLDGNPNRESYIDCVSRVVGEYRVKQLVHFEIEDRGLDRKIRAMARRFNLRLTTLRSPMFLNSRKEFSELVDTGRPRMADFYRRQRQRLNILIDDKGNPLGGRWSFDKENRKPLPKGIPLIEPPLPKPTRHVRDVAAVVNHLFPDSPGSVDNFWFPTTRSQAFAWLKHFLEQRLTCFGDFEDAMSNRSNIVFHSVLSPLLNIGLLTPQEVVDRATQFARNEEIALNNLEGFVRQVIGWREFIRGIYQSMGPTQERRNFWRHYRRLTPDWYRGTTGLLPLDAAIKKADRLGWAHHIERLMVVGNLMTLCEIHPRAAHRWFMEMFVDSDEWVMGPNVYGMALFSDGGMFATKPYICGSNYLMRMSDYPRGDWCETIDGLFWRFIQRHRDYFAAQPRLAVMVGNLDRMSSRRRESLFGKAEEFLAARTIPRASDESLTSVLQAGIGPGRASAATPRTEQPVN